MAKPQVLKYLFIGAIVLGAAFCICSWVTANKCYITPCEEGTGRDMLYKVDYGLGFQVVVTGLTYMVYAVFGYYVINKELAHHYGLLTGISLMFVLIQLETAILWGAQALTVIDLTGYYWESGRESVANVVAKHVFTADTVFATFLFLLTSATTVLLFLWKDEMSVTSMSSGVYSDNVYPPESGVADSEYASASYQSSKDITQL